MIIERTKVAYRRLDSIVAGHFPNKPLYHSLSQLHRTINEIYSDGIVIGIREMYEAITDNTKHGFRCILSEEQGYIVYYDPQPPTKKHNIPSSSR